MPRCGCFIRVRAEAADPDGCQHGSRSVACPPYSPLRGASRGTTLSHSSAAIAPRMRPINAAITTVTGSELHSCGLTPAGAAWCWGVGLGGQLGDGSQANSTSPLAVAGNHAFTAIASPPPPLGVAPLAVLPVIVVLVIVVPNPVSV